MPYIKHAPSSTWEKTPATLLQIRRAFDCLEHIKQLKSPLKKFYKKIIEDEARYPFPLLLLKFQAQAYTPHSHTLVLVGGESGGNLHHYTCRPRLVGSSDLDIFYLTSLVKGNIQQL